MALQYDVRKTINFKLKTKYFEIYKKSHELQKELDSIGVAWHNPFSDECNNDFGCCSNIGNYEIRVPSIENAQIDAIKAFVEHFQLPEKQSNEFIDKFIKSYNQ